MFADMMAYNEQLVKAGIMLAGDGLRPSSSAKRVHFKGDKRSVTDGPSIAALQGAWERLGQAAGAKVTWTR
jgi:hypothetical protein